MGGLLLLDLDGRKAGRKLPKLAGLIFTNA
jgi:hypothetical protein